MDEPDVSTQREEPSRPGAVGNTVAYVAVALSVMALLVSVIEVSFLRDESRAQAWPYIQLETSYSDRGYELNITNKGVGPAKLNSVVMRIDDEIVEDLDAAIVAAVGEENAFSYELYRISVPAPGVMSADEKTALFSVPWQDNTRLLAEAWSGRVDITACYCSIFEECWVATLRTDEPVPVTRCE